MHDGMFTGVMIWDINQAPITVSGNFKVHGDKLDLFVTKPNNLTPMKCIIQFNSDREVTLTFRDGAAIKRDGTSGRYRKII